MPLQVVKKSCYPRWNESFEFELPEPAGEKLCVEVWDWDLVSKNDFLGKVSPKKRRHPPLQVVGRAGAFLNLLFPPRWCSACRGCGRPGSRRAGSGCSPTGPSQGRTGESGQRGAPQGRARGDVVGTCTPCSCRRRGSLGSLQLQLRLRDETVLPSHCYQPLVQLLCQEVKSGRQVRGPGWGCGCAPPSGHHILVFLPSRTAGYTWSPSSMKQPRPSAGRRSPSTW